MNALVLVVVLFVAGFGMVGFGGFSGGVTATVAAEEIFVSVY